MRKLIKKALAPLVRELVQEQLEEIEREKISRESIENALLRILHLGARL